VIYICIYHSDLSCYVWLLYQYHQEERYVYHSDLSCHVSDYCISITKKSDRSITVIYHAMSLTTVSVSPRRVICLSQWFIMPCLWLLYQYLQEEWYVYHWFIMPCLLTTVSVSPRRVIGLSLIYHALTDYCISITKKSDRSITVFIMLCLTTVSVSPRRVIGLSLIYHAMSDYCISITKKNDRSITVIYHAMSDYCISITKKSDRYITVIYHAMSDYCISITKKSDMSITVIYHAMSLTTVSVSPRRVIGLSQWFITLCLWLLYQYH
jgi:hypothetical protein